MTCIKISILVPQNACKRKKIKGFFKPLKKLPLKTLAGKIFLLVVVWLFSAFIREKMKVGKNGTFHFAPHFSGTFSK